MIRLPQLLAASFTLLTLAPLAHADDPKFEAGKKEAVKGVEWKAQAKAGLTLTTGNSDTRALTAGALVSRKEAAEKFSLEGGVVYAKSEILLAADANGDGMIAPAEYSRSDTTTANSAFAKGRYDHFFTDDDAAYAVAAVATDKVSGKDLVAGGQIGYSRRIYKDDEQELMGELGYDLAYEKDSANPDSVIAHSIRVFAGDVFKVSAATSFFGNVEALFNVNHEGNALESDGKGGATSGVDAFADTRINAKAGITTALWTNVSFSFSYTVKYDHAPAPLPAFALPFTAGFVPFAEKTDTVAEAALIVNFI